LLSTNQESQRYFNVYELSPSPYTKSSLSASAVALALCQSEPVLNDGQSCGDSSRDNVIEGVRRKFIEKVVAQHEEREEDDDSD
jgi:acyl-CoA reductase-like NAD-dependent aldehyde dehydrogenase